MTTITIADQLINEVIAVSHYQNAQEAVIKILADYLNQQKQQSHSEKKAKQNRPFGLCAGEFAVPDDFDAPLPDDILALFE